VHGDREEPIRRRRASIRDACLERHARFVSDPVDDRLSKVRGEGTSSAILECAEVLQRPDDGVLDEIRGVEEIARVARQASRRPLSKDGQEPPKEFLGCGRISVPQPIEKNTRGLHRTVSATDYTGARAPRPRLAENPCADLRLARKRQFHRHVVQAAILEAELPRNMRPPSRKRCPYLSKTTGARECDNAG
jgi:hypothetical protein